MNGLSKVDRLRVKVRQARAETTLWREWAAKLLGEDNPPSDAAMRRAIAQVWGELRTQVNGDDE